MADITTYLENILSARYGEDVRGSIHDAIKAMNDNLEESGTEDILELRKIDDFVMATAKEAIKIQNDNLKNFLGLTEIEVSSYTEDMWISNTNGELVGTSIYWKASDYIDVMNYDFIFFETNTYIEANATDTNENLQYNARYDKNKNFIGWFEISEFSSCMKIDSFTKFIRFSRRTPKYKGSDTFTKIYGIRKNGPLYQIFTKFLDQYLGMTKITTSFPYIATFNKYLRRGEELSSEGWVITDYCTIPDNCYGMYILPEYYGNSYYNNELKKQIYTNLTNETASAFSYNDFYDEDNNFIGTFIFSKEWPNNTGLIRFPQKAKKLRFSFSYKPAIRPLYFTAYWVYSNGLIKTFEDEILYYSSGIGGRYQVDENFVFSKNGYRVSNLNGNLIETTSDYFVTDFIDVSKYRRIKFIPKPSAYFVSESFKNKYPNQYNDLDIFTRQTMYCATYDEEQKFIRSFSYDEDYISLELNEKYIRVTGVDRSSGLNLIMLGSSKDFDSNKYINKNHYEDLKPIIEYNADKVDLIKNIKSTVPPYLSPKYSVLSFIHCSDIHMRHNPFTRIGRFASLFEGYLDFCIHTGDFCMSSIITYKDLYNNLPKLNIPFLNCTGNHDTFIDDHNPKVEGSAEKSTVKQLIFNHSDEWDVTFSNSQNSLCYYKDFPDSHVRLIVVDIYYSVAEETEWFENILNDAKTKGYHVITAMHESSEISDLGSTFFPIKSDEEHYNSTFGMRERYCGPYEKKIKEFKESGGVHVINLVGHEHHDRFGKNKNEILTMLVDTAAPSPTWSDVSSRELKYYDNFNVCGVDVNAGIIKFIKIGATTNYNLRPRNVLTYDYINDKIIANY